MVGIASAATIVPVRDVAASADFYASLGFAVLELDPPNNLAIVARGAAKFMLLGGADAAALAATATNISAYLWAEDLDALWSELAPALASLPEGRLRAPFTQPYGLREFHVKDPDGFLMFFGQSAEPRGES